MFTVRGTDGGKTFTWEIRRFGGVTVAHGDGTFATQAEAWRPASAPSRFILEADPARVANRIKPATID